MGFYPPATLVRDGQRRRVETRPPDVNVSAAKCASKTAQCASASTTSTESAPKRRKAVVEERERSGVFASIRELAQRTQLSEHGLETLIVAGACDCSACRGASCSGSSVSCRAPTRFPGREARRSSSPCRSIPPRPRPSCPTPRSGSACSPTTARRTSPLACTRSSCCAPICRKASSPRATSKRLPTAPGCRRRTGRRPPAPVHRERRRLHAHRGRVRRGQPDRAAYGLRQAPRIVRGEPLILARGRFERIERNQNVLVRSLETLGPLAREVSQETEVGASLPGAHHFGHR